MLKNNRGSALLTALLIMTLAAAAASAMMVRQNFDIRRTEQMLLTDRTYMHALGVETWAILQLLAARANLEEGIEPVDTLLDAWAEPLPQTVVEEGYLQGQIFDLQGRFNLNNLLYDDLFDEEELEEELDANDEDFVDEDEEEPSEEPQEFIDPEEAEEILSRFTQLSIFSRLLMLVDPNLYEEDALQIALAVREWLAPDRGSLDFFYETAVPPYRPGHRAMASVTELRMVAGMTPELFDAVIDYVTVLPKSLFDFFEEEEGGQSNFTPINVNTAPPIVLQALLGGISEEEAEDILVSPGEEGFQSATEFLEAIELEDEIRAIVEIGLADKIGVSSDHFLVRGDAMLDRQTITLFSLLQRIDAAYVRVVWRSRGTL